MLEQQRWHAHSSDTNTRTDVTSTFVKPLHAGLSKDTSTYPYAAGTAIPPPPPDLYPPFPSQPKRNRVYVIAITVLVVLVVGLCSLEGVQLTTHTLFPTFPYGPAGSNQAVIAPDQHATAPLKTISVRLLTPGTIKENRILTCGVCNDPVHTTINSITIDTTNLRLIWTLTLQNQSGAQQIDYFAEFSLQDSLGNSYQGTGELNADFFLNAGQMASKTEIFSFLPRPGVSYTLIARFGISGLTYDPLQLTF
jgi:hypothetical protein